METFHGSWYDTRSGTQRSAARAAHGSRRFEVVVFWCGAAILALHAVVDSFVALEPGAQASDHLVRGAATLAVLALVAAAFPGLAPGGHAALSAGLGVLALEGAALAIAEARAAGARGEDWTGLLLLPVGAVFLVLAAARLWSSRKPGRRRHVRRAGIAIAAVLGAYWLVLPLGVGILATHRPRADVVPASLGRPYQAVTLPTSDGLELAAWYVPSRNGAAVISYPTRSGKVEQARMLVRNGYGVLLVDARGYDGSEGDPNVFGWDGTRDVDAAVAWLEQRPDVRDGRIGAIGFSVGGEVLLQAAAGNAALRAVVSEGAGVRSVREHLLRGPKGWFSLPEAAMQTLAVAVMSGTRPPPSLAKLVPRIAPRPVFFVYAGNGGGGEELNPTYYRAASAPKSMWKIEGARHVGGFETRPQEYEARVVGFFDRALLTG